jgi:UDP-N-acetyl-D-glucosamine dehydrogenase
MTPKTSTTDPMATLNALARGEAAFEALLKKIRTREARVAVMGLGYVGLPLVRLFASKGFRVMACDVDAVKVDSLNKGRSYIKSVPSETIAKHLAAGELTATSDFKLLSKADAIFVCVPTPLTAEGKPDVSSIRATAKSIGAGLRKGQLVVLESTSYPGTTREIMKPELEKRGLRCGSDFFLAFSPEREDPGNPDFGTSTIPKVVGGDGPDALALAEALYRQLIVKTVPVSASGM